MKNLLLTFSLCLLCVQATLVANNTPASGVVDNDVVPEAPVALVSSVSILNPDTIRICAGDTILLEQTNDCNDENLAWSTQFPGAGFIDAIDQPSVRAIPTVSQFYIVTTGPDGGPFASDSVFVDVDNLVIPEVISDTSICQGYPLQLIVNPVEDPQQTLYTWSPGADYLRDSTDVNSTFVSTNDLDTVFTLIATAANGACADTQMVDVTIIRSELNILAEDTIFRCLGDEPLVLEVSVDPFIDSGDVMWSPTTGAISAPEGVTYTVDPVGNLVYYAEGVVNGCAQIDSVAVRIDSLPPDMSFTVDPIKDPYCQGDTFTIQSPTYDVGDYPLISHEWLVAPGIASPQDLYNAVVFASDSALFTRVNVNGGCGDTTFTQINVIKPPLLIFDPENPVVCPGEELQINVSFDPSAPSGTLEWEDPIGGTLSCDDCLDPVATVPEGGVTYMITVTADGSECTSPASYTIQTTTDSPPVLTDDVLLCPGDSRQLILSESIRAGYTYQISGGDVMSNDPEVVVTPGATTTYTIVTTGLCESFTDEITLEVVEDYTASISGPSAVCPGDGVQLLADNSANRNGGYLWTLPDGSTASGPALDLDDPAPGTYSVTFTDAIGCSSATATYELVIVGANLEVDIVVTTLDGTIIEGGLLPTQSVVLTAVVTPPDLNVTYEWSGNFTPNSGTGSSIQISVPGSDSNPGNLNYTVMVTTDEGGCTAMATEVQNIITARVDVPDVITPNGDGTNDFFKIFYTQTADVEDFTLTIFNRWGQKVFTSTDIDEGWDGTVNGTPQNMDTYLFVSKFRLNGEEREQEGQFSLIR